MLIVAANLESVGGLANETIGVQNCTHRRNSTTYSPTSFHQISSIKYQMAAVFVELDEAKNPVTTYIRHEDGSIHLMVGSHIFTATQFTVPM